MKGGNLGLTFELGSQPSPNDDYFVATLAALVRIPAGALASFTLMALEAGDRAPRPASLALAEKATAHLI